MLRIRGRRGEHERTSQVAERTRALRGLHRGVRGDMLRLRGGRRGYKRTPYKADRMRANHVRARMGFAHGIAA